MLTLFRRQILQLLLRRDIPLLPLRSWFALSTTLPLPYPLPINLRPTLKIRLIFFMFTSLRFIPPRFLLLFLLPLPLQLLCLRPLPLMHADKSYIRLVYCYGLGRDV